MKILITGRGYDTRDRREIGIFEKDQAMALLAAGHDVRFAAIDTRSVRSRRPWGARTYELDGMRVYYAAVPLGNLTGNSNWAAQKMAAGILWKRIEKDGWRPDVVHSHFGGAFCGPVKAAGIPFVYTEHYSRSNAEQIPDWELARERDLYPRVDRLLCVSARQAETLRRNTGAEATVVHNVADTEAFSFRARQRDPSQPFRFAAAGNLLHRKGYDLLLRSLAELTARGIDCRLTVIGGGEEEAALRALAETLALSERVCFLGKQPRSAMEEVYREADAFVLASRLETFGVVYIEAMAAGLPVIATRCGGPEEFVNGENGFLIPAEDTAALTDAMERMVRERESFDSAAIARFARENFSPGTIAGKLTSIYKELLSC